LNGQIESIENHHLVRSAARTQKGVQPTICGASRENNVAFVVRLMRMTQASAQVKELTCLVHWEGVEGHRVSHIAWEHHETLTSLCCSSTQAWVSANHTGSEKL
jgi:hypothetical protein|tara:strand:- start:8 stop:319 length:312 start_codon:yes stop_codon:yes gene_type:complete